MADLTAQRTLVKSPPELWAEVSEVENLAKHLGELGEIKITRAVPETTVAWEGELISGTVELAQSGWGTKVTFHATVPEPDPPAVPEVVVAPEPVSVEPEPEPDPEPVAALTPEPPVDLRGFWARLFGRSPRFAEPEQLETPTVEFPGVAPEPEPEPDPVVDQPETIPELEDTGMAPQRVQEILDGTLDALGQAHHRPFSRG
jgi:hypothetical protein